MGPEDILKSEYEQLMAESREHLKICDTLVALEITALGVGIPIGVSHFYLLPLLGIMSIVLSLRYLDHVTEMYRIAAYVSIELREKFIKLQFSPDILGWEPFLRVLCPGNYKYYFGDSSTEDKIPAERWGELKPGLTYTFLLFGFAPPILLLAFCVLHPVNLVWVVVFIIGSLLSIVGVLRWIFSISWTEKVNLAIARVRE